MKRKLAGILVSAAFSLSVMLGTGIVSAAEVCATLGATQFVDGMRYCVTSALRGQGRNSYTPDNVFDGDPATAWCEGVRGDGTGESVTVTIQGGGPFRPMIVRNGYGKSEAAYLDNSRPRTVEIATDTGERFQEVLPDNPSDHYLMLPGPATYGQVRVTILDVYPGRKYADTCIGDIIPDFEFEELLLQRKQLNQPETSAQGPKPDTGNGGLEELPEFPSLDSF